MVNQSAEQPLGVLMISYKSDGFLEKRLSNLYPHQFLFRKKSFASMEGFLQSIKSPDDAIQQKLAQLHGITAWREGQRFNGWKNTQTLCFNDMAYCRGGSEYQSLLCQAYDALFYGASEFRDALRASLPFEFDHVGKTNMRDSVLTKHEYLTQLYRLRAKHLW